MNLYDRFIIILIKRAIIFSYTTILYINFKSGHLYSFIRPIDDHYQSTWIVIRLFTPIFDFFIKNGYLSFYQVISASINSNRKKAQHVSPLEDSKIYLLGNHYLCWTLNII